MAPPLSTEPRHIPIHTGKRTHQQTGMVHPATYTYGTATWPTTGGVHRQSVGDWPLEDPAAYLSKLDSGFGTTTHVLAKKPRVEGVDPSSLPSHPYNATAGTSLSSDMSLYSSNTPSEAMSRQSSATSASLVASFEMCRVESSVSGFSDSLPFTFEQEEDLHSSFLSSTTIQPSNSDAITDCNESSLLSSVGYGFVSTQQFPCYDLSSVVGMNGEEATSMLRSQSEQSNSSISSAELKASERRRKHIENSKRVIASKSLPQGPLSKHDPKARPLKPQEHGTKRKEAITKQPYIRPQHPKLLCTECNEFPNGFRGDHELKRHIDRAHAKRRKVWICVDPGVDTVEGWRPSNPVNICKHCNQKKHYNVYYNAAAHLRRAHFCPRKRGRKARGEERESRAGKAGGDWPPIEWLKNHGWLKEIEIGPDEAFPDDAAEDQDESFDYGVEDQSFGFDVYHDNLTAEELSLATYQDIDYNYSYPTPLDTPVQWPAYAYQQPAPVVYGMNGQQAMMMAMSNNNGSMYYS